MTPPPSPHVLLFGSKRSVVVFEVLKCRFDSCQRSAVVFVRSAFSVACTFNMTEGCEFDSGKDTVVPKGCLLS